MDARSAKATTLRLRGGIHILDWLDGSCILFCPKTDVQHPLRLYQQVKTQVFGAFAKPNVTSVREPLRLVGFAQSKMEFQRARSYRAVKPNRAWRTAVGVPVPLHQEPLGSIDYVHYSRKSNFGGGG